MGGKEPVSAGVATELGDTNVVTFPPAPSDRPGGKSTLTTEMSTILSSTPVQMRGIRGTLPPTGNQPTAIILAGRLPTTTIPTPRTYSTT